MSMADAADVATPALDKLSAKRDQTEAIGPFLEWLLSDGTHLMRRGMSVRACYVCGGNGEVSRGILELRTERCASCSGTGEQEREGWIDDSRSINQLLAAYLDLDEEAMEDERRALLEAIRV